MGLGPLPLRMAEHGPSESPFHTFNTEDFVNDIFGNKKPGLSMPAIAEPYIIHYPELVALSDPEGRHVELVEFFDCTGGAMWSRHHYTKSPLVESARQVGSTMRYLLRPGNVELPLQGSTFPAGISGVVVEPETIAISYLGMGGGGVGASVCRSTAKGVVRCETDPSGGGKVAGSTVWLPRRERLLIGIDDTDTREEGATWTLAHNISRAVEDDRSRYLSHTIVQLFPVPFRTKNCVATVCEFATSDPPGLVARYRDLLSRYTLSKETGMAVYRGFDPSPLLPFGRKVQRGQVSPEELAVALDGSATRRRWSHGMETGEGGTAG
ncbi:MAG: tRNA(Ile2) 2-agmatinylcytidine synthetase [Methanomicrobia archaeon]|nr:tRNA(Ile2) 2-agmatinylcytidine synthetase [Methanomicrobia archaeon]